MQENTYFRRTIDSELLAWCNTPNRKTLLLRGARQVGKSSAVQHLAKSFALHVPLFFQRVFVCFRR